MATLDDKDLVIAIVATCMIFFVLTVFIIAYILLYQKRNTRHRNEIGVLKHEFESNLLQSQLEIREQTLQHIAYELHDNLGQIASLIKINLNTLDLNNPVTSVGKIEDTKELIRQLITDLKSLSLSLNSTRIAQLGIVKGLELETDRLNRTGLFKAEFEQNGILPVIGQNTVVILYRMAQEILNNAVKHSGATSIKISTFIRKNFFILVCADNGVGFDLEKSLEKESSGLMNLYTRARLIHANLKISSEVGTGTSISIELPINESDRTT